MCGMAATSASGTNAVRSACMAGTQIACYSDGDIYWFHTVNPHTAVLGGRESLFESNTAGGGEELV